MRRPVVKEKPAPAASGAGWFSLPPIDTRKTRWEYHWDTLGGRRGMTSCRILRRRWWAG